MATIVRGTIPAKELALNHTLKRLPEIEIECERIVQGAENAIIPLLWVRYPDRDELDATLEADPTVKTVTCLSAYDDEYLYQMEWIDHVHLLLHMITNEEATILDAYGWNNRWVIRALYPNREHFSRSHEFAEQHGLTFEIATIREMEGQPAGRYGLTDSQYRALVLAAERGYFEVPKEVTLEELADEIGVTHQSLSEQLRRGIGALVEDTLFIGTHAGKDDEQDKEP